MKKIIMSILFILTVGIIFSSCSVGKTFLIRDMLPEFNDPVKGTPVIEKIKVTRLSDNISKEFGFSEAESFQLSYSSVKCYKKSKPSDISWDYKAEYITSDGKTVFEILIGNTYNFLINDDFYEAENPDMGADIYYIENLFRN